MIEEKLSPLFSLKEVLSEEEAGKMGRKDPEEEVEKFVSANTQELGKDKWLCPLSGKKFKVRAHKTNYSGLNNTLRCWLYFCICYWILIVMLRPSAFQMNFKGPEFVRKHILNKHGDKIEEVKKEVAFFNNFLMDAKRPSLPEMKLPPLPGPGQGRDKISISSTKIIVIKDFSKTEWINRSTCCIEAWITGSYQHLLSYRFAFSQHAVSSPGSSGSHELWTASSSIDGLWWYVLQLHFETCLSAKKKTTLVLTAATPFQQAHLLTPPTNSEEAGATMTTSADKVATWGSHATSGETTVRVIAFCHKVFLLMESSGPLFKFLLFFPFSFLFAPSTISECHAVTHATSLNIVTWMLRMIWTSFRKFTRSFSLCSLPVSCSACSL